MYGSKMNAVRLKRCAAWMGRLAKTESFGCWGDGLGEAADMPGWELVSLGK